jgi:hypothetical protein
MIELLVSEASEEYRTLVPSGIKHLPLLGASVFLSVIIIARRYAGSATTVSERHRFGVLEYGTAVARRDGKKKFPVMGKEPP